MSIEQIESLRRSNAMGSLPKSQVDELSKPPLNSPAGNTKSRGSCTRSGADGPGSEEAQRAEQADQMGPIALVAPARTEDGWQVVGTLAKSSAATML